MINTTVVTILIGYAWNLLLTIAVIMLLRRQRSTTTKLRAVLYRDPPLIRITGRHRRTQDADDDEPDPAHPPSASDQLGDPEHTQPIQLRHDPRR